jgi:hypothetical protein
MDSFMEAHVYSIVHWPFFAFAFVAMLFNQVMKSAIFTKARAITKGKGQWFFWWARKTLPLHPVLVGALVGFIWRNPEQADPTWPWIAPVFYFALAGTLSVWIYQIIKGIAKKKGIELEPLPGYEETNL